MYWSSHYLLLWIEAFVEKEVISGAVAYVLPLLTFNILFSTSPVESKIRRVGRKTELKRFKENKKTREAAGFGGTLFRLGLEE